MLTTSQLGKTLFHQGDLSYFEAVNKETLRNSYLRFEEDGMIHVIKSKDPKIAPRIQLDPSWRIARDPATGALRPEGKLWEFIEKISSSRLEGKNRRDGPTVSSRVTRLADMLGRKLFEEAQSGEQSRLTGEEKEQVRKARKEAQKRMRRKLEARPML